MVSHDNCDGVDATTGDHFVDSLCLADAFNKELHSLLECVLVLGKQDICIVAKEEAESIAENHSFCICEVVHFRQVVGFLLEE